jgi:two-component system phosphate regulon response regulator PhoB
MSGIWVTSLEIETASADTHAGCLFQQWNCPYHSDGQSAWIYACCSMRLLPRVLIVDDEPAIAELISINLRHNGFTPFWAEDGESAQRELDNELPDVILLDWMLPGENGLLLARKWHADQRTRRVPIVMLTARGDEADKVAALDAGADDYITKPFSTQELLARIRAVMRRNFSDPASDKVTVGLLTIDAATHRVTFKGQHVRLGPTEFKLLHYFMTHAERTHTRSQVLDTVWNDDALIEERTVDVHVKRLRDALGEAGAMIETVRGAGYRFTTDSQPRL